MDDPNKKGPPSITHDDPTILTPSYALQERLDDIKRQKQEAQKPQVSIPQDVRSEPGVMSDDTLTDQPSQAPTPRGGSGNGSGGGKLRKWVGRLAVLTMALTILGAIVVGLTVVVLSKDLPELRTLADYQPKQATVVYGAGGQVVARFADERRTVVRYEQIPKVMIEAVLSAEDDNFFQHEGVDYLGIARCLIKNVIKGRKACGASTITQQTVKTFFLTPKKTYTRKLREIILAKRVEEALKKEDILFLYLNQIYYGHGAYGVQAAAKIYFGKDVSGLTVEEAALLAGLPQSPSRLDPYKHPERALKRRRYVLRRMHELKKIDTPTYEAAKIAPLQLDWSGSESDLDSNNHYSAHVRKVLSEMSEVGEERTKSGGLRVYTGVDPAMQRQAELALKNGLRDLDKRQGWRGPMLHLETNELKALKAKLTARRTKIAPAKDDGKGLVIWDLSRINQRRKTADIERLAEETRFPRLKLEGIFGGLVVAVDDPAKEARVSLGGTIVHLPLRTGLSWARKFSLARWTRRPSAPSKVLKVGDIVLVRPTALKSTKDPSQGYIGVLEQRPKAQSALVVIDPASREVRAMVGGYGIGAGTFNRAIQARRQAGSTFKPIVYASAFDTQKYNPITLCLDAPRVYRDPWTGRSWKPENYGGKFDGEITLRRALTLSKNLCSVELIDRVGVGPVLEMAKKVGVKSPLPRNLTVALGSGDVTPLEMVNSYATLATQGQYAEPVFIRKVVAPDGKVLFESKLDSKQVIRPEVAYQVTSLMQSVVEDGTARRVKSLERPVAGKTGTTNEARNAWFIGFTPGLVAGVWVGFDNNDPLGPRETGGRAAIPIWLGFMSETFKGKPVRDFAAPASIVFALVDPKTGKLTTPDNENAVNEPFIAGTEPTEFSESQEVPTGGVLFDDY